MPRVFIAALIPFLFVAKTSSAIEAWADAKLPTDAREGLVLWLDVQTQNAARKTQHLAEFKYGEAVPVWYDASGFNRDLKQPNADARPKWQITNGGAALRFDGKNDSLAIDDLKQTFDSVTFVIVAAPFSCENSFVALMATNESGKNDYQSGINIDLGPNPSAALQYVNIEGSGFGGATNLMKQEVSFGKVTSLVVTSEAGAGGTKLSVNGTAAGQRGRAADTKIRADRLTVGARFYNNGGAPDTRGFIEADIFEVLVFDRVLTEAAAAALQKYLKEKYAGVTVEPPHPLARADGHLIQSMPKPPPVQMLVPGFSVTQLPIELKNVNNILYRHDGKLVAMTYNGDIYLLTDTNGDGLEDKAELFWENKGRIQAPIGMDLTPEKYAKGEGVLTASKRKVSLIVDKDGDGKADEEIILAEGWPMGEQHGVDALGAAFDRRDGSLYFGIGTAAYTNGFLVDKAGQGHYSLTSERGTILHVSPDFKKREIVCTGIRFPVGIRFNAANDLFCTDQEGATWLANGNPLDELLHIEPGRHYGFPPRHPKHLPNVHDEPSVCDYSPQHQSTCGLNFNEPVNGGPVFGPASWRGDVFVSGYSRGKLWHTTLQKSAAGYISHNQLLACLDMLTVDACVSPTGDLVVACHSGAPDWGSGPNGMGRLYKIRYTEKDAPQPVCAWASGPGETAVAFDRPIDAEQLKQLSSVKQIEYGPHVYAGDRFEKLWPGYQVVQMQRATRRHWLPVLAVSAAPDRRTIFLQTPPDQSSGGRALTLPGWGRPAQAAAGTVAQEPVTDLRYDGCGLSVRWRSSVGNQDETIWWPHLDVAAAKKFTAQSATHEQFWPNLNKPGLLSISAQLDLWQMLIPAVQPGSSIDYKLPDEEISVIFSGPPGMSVTLGGAKAEPVGNTLVAKLTITKNEWLPLTITLTTGTDFKDLTVHYFTSEDPRPRAFQPHRFRLPWISREATTDVAETRALPPEVAGGDWARGRAVFYGEKALCSRCHSINSRGGHIGPDLSNLVQRDAFSVLRDIRQPSAAINPDHVAYMIKLNDGRVFTGIPRNAPDGKIIIGDNTGQETAVARDSIQKMTPQALSLMPEGLEQAMGPENFKDLLAFLLLPPLQPAPLEIKTGVPPPRTRAEVRAIIEAGSGAEATPKPLNIVLVSGPKDHGPGEHDYPLWQKRWSVLLGLADCVKVSTAQLWPSKEQFEQASVLVFYQQGKWTPERAADMEQFMKRGGGTVYLHYAVDGGSDPAGFSDHIGLAWKGGQSAFRHGALDLKIHDREHPIFRGFPENVKFIDESYWKLAGDPAKIKTLASGVEEGAAQPLAWTYEHGGGRVFVTILGHYSWTIDDPLFRLMVLRGICWSANMPADRLSELSLIGARLQE